MEIRWDPVKSERLKRTRGVSFEEMMQANLISIKQHPTKEHQRLLLYERNEYIWCVPFVRGADEVFLKTLYPSRYWTWKFRKGEL